MPEISVIVPVYNVEKYLSRCIDSILAQSFTDYEIVLVDDGSTDDSGKICDVYSKRDSRIIVFHQNNQGVSVARNNGLIAAKGKYISFVDSDDWISESYLDRLYKCCMDSGAQMSICKVRYVSTNYAETPNTGSVRVLSKLEALDYFGTLMDVRFCGPVGKLIETSIVKNHFFPKDRRYAEDAACVYRWMNGCKLIVDVPEEHYYYYQRSDSVVHIEYDWHRLDAYQTFDEMLVFFQQEQLRNPYIALLSKYVHEMMDGYERCKLSSKTEIENAIQANLKKVISREIGVNCESIIEQREELIPVFAEFDERLANRYLKQCCYGLYLFYNQNTNEAQRNDIKRRLKKFASHYHLSIKEYSYFYEAICPRKAKLFWLIKSLQNRIIR